MKINTVNTNHKQPNFMAIKSIKFEAPLNNNYEAQEQLTKIRLK